VNDLHLIGVLAAWGVGSCVYYMGRSHGFDPVRWLGDQAGWLAIVAAAASLATVALRVLRRVSRSFAPGDRVIYYMQKWSPRPGPRAECVYAAPGGESYCYLVPKPWTVTRVLDDRAIEVVTRGGKHRIVQTNDPRIRRAGPWSAFWFSVRSHRSFPRPPDA
jgi:hypothetical protein